VRQALGGGKYLFSWLLANPSFVKYEFALVKIPHFRAIIFL
jgi:hypothetical protein